MTAGAFERENGPLPRGVRREDLPCIAGMDLTMRDPNVPLEFVNSFNLDYRPVVTGFALTSRSLSADKILRFLNA